MLTEEERNEGLLTDEMKADLERVEERFRNYRDHLQGAINTVYADIRKCAVERDPEKFSQVCKYYFDLVGTQTTLQQVRDDYVRLHRENHRAYIETQRRISVVALNTLFQVMDK